MNIQEKYEERLDQLKGENKTLRELHLDRQKEKESSLMERQLQPPGI